MVILRWLCSVVGNPRNSQCAGTIRNMIVSQFSTSRRQKSFTFLICTAYFAIIFLSLNRWRPEGYRKKIFRNQSILTKLAILFAVSFLTQYNNDRLYRNCSPDHTFLFHLLQLFHSIHYHTHVQHICICARPACLWILQKTLSSSKMPF